MIEIAEWAMVCSPEQVNVPINSPLQGKVNSQKVNFPLQNRTATSKNIIKIIVICML